MLLSKKALGKLVKDAPRIRAEKTGTDIHR
jgi:hypothetical protein